MSNAVRLSPVAPIARLAGASQFDFHRQNRALSSLTD